MSILRPAIAATAFVALSACGGDAAQSGENLIETELEEQIGLGELDASCDEPDDRETGTQFTCTARTEDDRVIEFIGTFTSETEIYVEPINLAPADLVDFWEVSAAELLSGELGFEIDPATFECPTDDPVFLDVSAGDGTALLDCIANDPASGEQLPLRLTLSDFVAEQGYQTLFAEVGAAVD